MSNRPLEPNDLDETPADAAGEEESPEEGIQEIEMIPSQKIAWLQEFSFTATKILILVVTLVVILLSIVAKVDWWIIILRASVSILSLGFLGFLLNWFLGKSLIEAKLIELKEKQELEEAAEAERLAREQAEMDALLQLQREENQDGINIEF